MARLKEALGKLKDRTDLLVGFAPPLYDAGCQLLLDNPKQASFWKAYLDKAPQWFAELNQPFADCSSPSKLGLDDRSMLDGCHGEEVVAAHVLLALLRDRRVTLALPKAEHQIRQALASPNSNLWYLDFGAVP